MARVQEYLVSTSGQMSLPAPARHRWGLDRGGRVDVVDLGFAVLTLPVGAAAHLLSDLLSRDEHARAVAELATDADLATT
jgi:bifunctional DNA-binding transcriptional regulator/antitoxin component of YhaV-PrlF toxin-antitoxin module